MFTYLLVANKQDMILGTCLQELELVVIPVQISTMDQEHSANRKSNLFLTSCTQNVVICYYIQACTPTLRSIVLVLVGSWEVQHNIDLITSISYTFISSSQFPNL